MTTTPPLTKREYFAALALPSLVSSFWSTPEFRRSVKDDAHARGQKASYILAGMASEFADALLADLAATAPAPAKPMHYGPPPPGYYEQHEALRKALTAAASNWLPHDGGPMPCAPQDLVEVKHRCGWLSGTPDCADDYCWPHAGEAHDIVAWRIAKP